MEDGWKSTHGRTLIGLENKGKRNLWIPPADVFLVSSKEP